MDAALLVVSIKEKRPSIEQAQDAICWLKASGYDRGDSMVILQRAYGIGYKEAKVLIYQSRAWSADRSVVEKLHEQLDHDLGGTG